MTTLTDIANDLDRYPLDETTIEIFDVTPETDTGSEINIDEDWKFKVRVTNNGHINMINVALHITGSNGAQVRAKLDEELADGIVVGNFTVGAAGGIHETKFYHFRAPPDEKPAGTGLVNAHINDWNGNFDQYFTNHTKNEEDATVTYPRVTYSAEVVGD